MVYFDIGRLFPTKKKKEEQRIMKKAKEQGVDSLIKEERLIYKLIKSRAFLA